MVALPLMLLGCASRLGAPAAVRTPETGQATSSAQAGEDPVTPFEVTLVDQAQDASDPAEAPGPRRFESLEVDASGALLARIERRSRQPCQAARLDASGAMVVPLPCPEPGYHDWQTPDGELVAHMELVGRGVLTAPSWRLIAQRRESEERIFVAHGGPGFQPKVTWSARGHHMLVAGAELLFFDVDTRRAWGRKIGGFVEADAMDADGARAAFATPDGSLGVVSRDANDPVLLGRIDGHVRQVALAGDHVAVATEAGDVGVWSVTRRERQVAMEGAGPVQGLAWSADGEVLAVLSHGALRLVRWDGKGELRLKPVFVSSSVALVASDAGGRVEAPGDAMALVRWRVSAPTGETRLLDESAMERVGGASRVAPGLMAQLFAGGH